MAFQEHLKNTEWEDRFGFKNVNVKRNVIYNGNYGIFSKTYDDTKEYQRRPLAAAVLGLNNTDIPLPDDLNFQNIWTDADAQEAYLKHKPKTYLIVGKQGTGSYNFGEALSKKLNCVHLCPKNVLIDEIEQKSSTGKCLDFNMRHNKVCKFDIIFPIVKEKLKSPAVLHRGFITSGLPLITSSENHLYFISSLYTEESVMIAESVLLGLVYGFKKKKSKINKSASDSSLSVDPEMSVEEEVHEEQEIEIEEENDQMVELPKFILEPCNNIVFHTNPNYTTTKILILNQMRELFYLNPSILIFITCPNVDLVKKRGRKFLNYMNNSSTFFSFLTNMEHEVRWPVNYNLSDFKRPHDTHTFNPKYNCKQPINFMINATQQLCNYKHIVNPFIELKLNDFDPKAIIKLDGRFTTYQMLHISMERIQLMPIKPVIIPEPLYLDDPPDNYEEFWSFVEDLNVIRSGNIKFNRYASIWYNRCPVELKKRKSTQGKQKFAVTFFKYIYLMSSLDAMVKFCRNPRPFLKLEYLEPTCRIIITGTKCSGKSMIAECLSWIFNVPIICFSDFVEKERQKKYNTYAKTIFSEIVFTIEDGRLTKWQNLELDRISKLNTWFNTQYSILNSYVPLLRKKLKHSEEEQSEENWPFLNKFHSLRKQLSFLSVDDLEECEYLLKSNNLIKLAPIDLTTEMCKPETPKLGDLDVSDAISAYIKSNELDKEIEPTSEEVMTKMVEVLKNIDSESLNKDQAYGKYIIDGFTSNPEFWKYLIQSNLLPDYTISLIENREIDLNLLQHYTEVEKAIKNYQERYLLSNDPMIKLRLCLQKPETTTIDIKIIVEQLYSDIYEILNGKETDNNDEIQNTDLLLSSFTENIDKFREDWDVLKLNIDENLKAFIEIELENKTDIEVLDEVLLNLRKSYVKPPLESDENIDNEDDDNESTRNDFTYNDPYYLGETNVYCPVAFYDYGILWKGKPEFLTKNDNKVYYTCNEDSHKILQNDITRYQSYCKPIKNIPPLRICVIGCVGSGKTTISKIIAKEFGLLHIDFSNFINDFLLPKHFKKCGWQFENSFKDTDVDEEEVLEFQMDEETSNNIFDLIYNEKELRRMVYNYLERGSPLPSILNQTMLKKLWFDNTFITSGIVVDGFPKMPSDVEDMIVSFSIPDLVINLESDPEISVDRISSQMFNKWKIQLMEAKTKTLQKLEAQRKDWKDFVTKTVVIQLIIDEILGNIFLDIEMPLESSSVHSTIIDADPSGSSNVDVKLFTLYNELIQDYPEPTDQTEWETADDVLEKINNRLESIFDIDDENIQTLRDILDEQNIKTILCDGKKSLHKVKRNVLTKLSGLRIRCESFFEQTFVINCDIAEMLLLEGFFLLSKFNRMCPVFIFENRCTLFNSYGLNRHKNNIFPIIHRSYIYFVSSEKNVGKFRLNPLKYIQNDAITFFKEYPLRFGVIGPPKSGKSKLASKLAKKYGLMCISKGMTIRHILENMDWTVLGSKMLSQLREGNCVDNELIMKAMTSITNDNRVMTNGFVLDGFPESPYDVCELSKVGLFPLMIFDLNSDKEKILKNSQNEIYYDTLKRQPTYSRSLIEFKYNKWHEKCSKVRNWINEDTQNICNINGNNSQWQCYSDASKKIENNIPEIHYYLSNSKSEAVRANVMCISDETFQQRMSGYKNLCPVCFNKNILRHSGFPADKKGIVQYKEVFYWVCSEHLKIVLQSPKLFLSTKNISLPELPAPVKVVNTSLVYENGICLVTYAENLPAQILMKGHNEFAAIYRKNIYLFCSPDCHKKFLAKPNLYYNIRVFNETVIFPELKLKKLPHLGFLEQSLGNIITEACCAVNVNRPKYPGLDIHLSAVLFIALYLKTHNTLLDEPILSAYKKALGTFEARCRLIRDIGMRLRSIDNPFAKYQICCRKLSGVKQIDSETVRKPSSNFTTNKSSFSI